MQVTRLYTGNDGESHFEDIEIPTLESVQHTRESKPLDVVKVFFRENSGSFDLNWHKASYPQFIIILEGKLEVEASDGTKRSFGPGKVLFAEDITGPGHLSRSMDRKALVIQIA